jgi:hypothetical protein
VKKRWFFFLFFCLVLVLVITSLCLQDREPQYKGKTMSEWAEIYESSFQPPDVAINPSALHMRHEALDAVRGMRDQVLPRALKLIRYEKPEWKNNVEHFMEFRLDVRRWCPTWIWFPFYGDPGGDCVIYFEMLGPEASATVPELVQIINDEKPPESLVPVPVVQDRAMYALSCIGKESLPPLMEMLADPNSPYRRRAAYAIGDINRLHGSGVANPAVPLLINRLKDPDQNMSTAAATVLGDMAIEADIAVPALASCLKNNDEDMRSQAAESLQNFGERARAAVPSLINALNDPDLGVRDAATNALLHIAPEVLEKVSVR